ncbi:hypothetical protein [Spiroplasma melliferum]|uniref:Uncharacterized protein n=2 Tax=Spiroplasma melliferum TaxID=2134 RepID=A0AAI9X0V2_SPIME|nr:hypothetical protein [Spiroplasma melliferum]ELL44175.1 hypothetical protein SMIPMB4A_v3c9050 [Spiroplasma melliferum IPMB4A]KAI92305.1 hypothetical protein SPM_006225 [Spiroplasma melliferum KC3]QCO23738.1 hypothetical protein SRED_002212 [Spiroplasma melliferum]
MDTNYVQNEQENVQTNVIQNKKPDNLCRAGCIIAIVLSSLALIGLSIGGLMLLGYGVYAAAIIYLIIAGVEIVPIIMCNNVLKGKVESNLAAGIIALLFSGLVSGILILIGKYENEKPQGLVTN